MKRLLLLPALALASFAATPDECWKLERRGQWEAARPCFTSLAATGDPYLRAEGLWGLEQYFDANESFKLAIKLKPQDPHYRVRWGRLFLERYVRDEAAKLFQEALAIRKDYPPALIGVALVAAQGFEQKAVEAAEQAVKLDPKLAEGHEVLAMLALEDGNTQRAAEQADKALTITPEALDALAVKATIEWMKQPDPSPATTPEPIARALKINPRFGEGYALAAHTLVINRRYEEGIAFYRKALELHPRLWEARTDLGINLMRLGREDEARRHLEASYNAGYKSAPTVNTLTLLDSYKNFQTFKTPQTIVKLHKKEAALLKPYMESELARAIRTFEKKYKTKLTAPVQLEVYPDHEDFAVRTLGMPGLGALGVTFGTVVAMDSPSGRRPGSFHWASTLWHELSHVFVLTATSHRVPRWFTEGVAVHEETAVDPEWGDRLNPDIIRAIQKKRLLPVADLDRGFIRPSYPNQVIVSYFQAGRICDYIVERWNYDKLLQMMNLFAQSKATPEVIQTALGLAPEAFDKDFLAWLDKQVKRTVDGYDDWMKRYKVLLEGGKLNMHDEVIREGTAIRDIFPEYVEARSVYEILAEAYLAKGDKKNALAELDRYARAGGRFPETLKKLAALQEEAGDRKGAAATLTRINYIYPVQDEELHRKLGELWLELGQPDRALVELQAALASKPLDPAAAHFRLAQAYHKLGRLEQAKDELFSALEAAPGYRPAQKLMLELESAATRKSP
ncbi:MAG: tetratricopeptide repeat protein [Bryobacteraceae bacterium]|nr:tetratricopeptide repeat protein [Bryobacteraceae bacterium]